MMRFLFVAFFLIIIFVQSPLYAAEWQWSVEIESVISTETKNHPRAFLWIPDNCYQVRGVILGQHNMTEEGILEHPAFRNEMRRLGFAEIWVTPGFNMVFDFYNGAGEQFDELMNALAKESGYSELAFAPVVPVGHSAYASFPWNFAAWNPERTLAVLSVHGDAPLTSLTGSGRPNPDWGNRNIDGVPGLMVVGEYEWWEDRVQPALNFKERFPNAAISFLCDAGRGHFDFSDALVDYLALFVRKAAQIRLPDAMSLDKPVLLKSIDPKTGWLAQRWRKDHKPEHPAATFTQYQGEKKDAFWYFDKEMALATEKYYASVRGKKDQFLGFMQNDSILSFNPKLHARVMARFEPETDGLTFHVKAIYTDTLRSKIVDDHANSKPVITRICGPVQKVNDTTFTVHFYRMGLNNQRRTDDIWLLAACDGDKNYKSSVQQLNIRIPYQNTQGKEQIITFEPLPNVKQNVKSILLNATSDSNMPVCFYVQDGPAEIVNGRLVFTKIPPRSKFPVNVTVVAWQYGRSVEPKVQTAEPVVRSFDVEK